MGSWSQYRSTGWREELYEVMRFAVNGHVSFQHGPTKEEQQNITRYGSMWESRRPGKAQEMG
jgi:hypothetical protein